MLPILSRLFREFRPLRLSTLFRGRGALWGCGALLLAACGGEDVPTDPVYVDDGQWILDSVYTLSEFPYQTSACAEVYPGGSVNVESVPAGSVADLRIISTSCYHVRVRVIDADSDTVRTLDVRFGIFNRTEEEKNRGVVGYLAWDGKDEQGTASAPGRYLWRMEFDFGDGRIRKYRTIFTLP